MSFHYRHRKVILLCIIIVFLISTGVFFLYKGFYKKKVSKDDIVLESKNDNTLLKKESTNLLKVDIKGEIKTPGIYSLKSDSRVIDVINIAGGLTDNADTTVINLSKKIKDEMVIIIYSRDEVNDFKKIKEIEKQVQSRCLQKDNDSLSNDACIDDVNNFNTSSTLKININTAGVEELKSLPGIGDNKAQSIVDYRNKNGLFSSVHDLMNVDGIGEGLYAQIEAYITIK